MAYKNSVKKKENDAKYYEENKEKRKEYRSKRQEELKQCVVIFITTGEIIDQKKWDMWCNEIKRCAKNKKHPYSGEFTNDIIFDMMIQGCFYCGNIATTIDRVDSTLDHALDNCVASCEGCNYSKGAADPATFIRKAYYRSREGYADDITDIWFVNKQKPSMWHYKKSADKKGVVFDLTKEYFENIIKDNCKYCQRSPTTWFGIDRVKPEYGYVVNNIVTCCYDCNLDKHVNDIDAVKRRNERIAKRVDTGDLVIEECLRVILHNGTNKSSKKVCAYGKVYENKAEASRALGKGDNYVCECIMNGIHRDDIFEINDGFYKEHE